MQPFICIGDKTSHGGVVIGGSTVSDAGGRQIARAGDRVTCPIPGHGPVTVIVGGDSTMIIDGQPAAYHGHKTACGAILLSSQSVTGFVSGSASSAMPALFKASDEAMAAAAYGDPQEWTAQVGQAAVGTQPAPAPAAPTGDPSGSGWVSRYPTSSSTSDLASPFRENAESFIAALKAAGAIVSVNATLRPPERAYLMHNAWSIVKAGADPQSIPAKDGVDIQWAHQAADGSYDSVASLAGAQEMVDGYGIQSLGTAPALNSRHIEGNAIDMSISWFGTLTIRDATGNDVTITSTPRDGMNANLATVGASYGVQKFVGGAKDIPHWSTDGH